MFPLKLYAKSYVNFQLDFVPLQKDWALAKVSIEHKQKKLRCLQTISFRVAMVTYTSHVILCNSYVASFHKYVAPNTPSMLRSMKL